MASPVDWYNTFLSNDRGRKVLLELRSMCITWFRADEDKPLAPDEAYAQCILDELVLRIDAKLGIDRVEAEMKMIEHMAVVAAEVLGERSKEQGPEPRGLHDVD